MKVSVQATVHTTSGPRSAETVVEAESVVGVFDALDEREDDPLEQLGSNIDPDTVTGLVLRVTKVAP